MFTTVQSTPIRTATRTRRTGLIGWLVRWNAAHRENARFTRLTEDQRRDMGLPADKIKVAEIMARSGQ